jgi:HlyD family secretion protein
VLTLFVLLVAGCRGDRAKDGALPSPTPFPSAGFSDFSGAVETAEIRALGTLRPAQTLQLSFLPSGQVRTVDVRLGAAVKAGDLLAELDTTPMEIELASARQEVALRQAALDGLPQGPSAPATAALIQRAEAEHAQQVAEAEVALEIAQWQLEQARLQAQGPEVAIAQSRLRQSELQQSQAQAQARSLESQIVAAQADLARAQDALQGAQIAYKEALDRPWEPQRVRDALAQGVVEAERSVRVAQAALAGVVAQQRAQALGLEMLATQIEEAASRVAQSVDAQAAYSATLSRLEAEVDLARLRLEGLGGWENPYLDPPSPAEVAQAAARLQQAQLAVAELEWRLQGAQIRAPFDGVVSDVYLSPSEWAAPGAPVVELLDISQWQVETRNVGELSIGRVLVGQEASVRVLAFRDHELRGRIVAISPVAVVQQGDTTYSLFVELEPTELNLRPGMNAEVRIEAE